MLCFDDVAEAVKRATVKLELRRSDAFASLRFYRTSGGPGASWRTAGAYLDVTENNRLVLEALYLERRDTCVIRVYEESPLEVFFARKFSIRADSCADILDSAVESFELRLPPRLPTLKRVSASLGLKVAQSTTPVPPPVNVAAVPG
jgi:hypothetical protein